MSRPAFLAKDLRYHSTWVLDQNGNTTSWPCQVAESTAPLKDCCLSLACTASGIGSRKPALANSAVKGGSRLIRSMSGSCAASRRDICTLCCVESWGSISVEIVYWSLLQFFAIAACPPTSGLMYQMSSGLLDPLEHAAR